MIRNILKWQKHAIVHQMYGIIGYVADKWIFHKYCKYIKIQDYLLSYFQYVQWCKTVILLHTLHIQHI